MRNCFSRAILLQCMLVLCSWHIPSLGSPQVFCGHPIHPEFVPDGVVSRGVWGQAAAGQAGGLQAGWDPPRTDQFWGCRTSICMPGMCLMLMVLDPSRFIRFCFSSTDLAEIARKGMWDTDTAHWKHWLAQQLCSGLWAQFLSLDISVWAVQERSSTSAQGLTDWPFRNCGQLQHSDFTTGVSTLPSSWCLPPPELSVLFSVKLNVILLFYNPTMASICGFLAFFSPLLCVFGRERNVAVLWSCLQKQSDWGNWYMILCSPDYLSRYELYLVVKPPNGGIGDGGLNTWGICKEKK